MIPLPIKPIILISFSPNFHTCYFRFYIWLVNNYLHISHIEKSLKLSKIYQEYGRYLYWLKVKNSVSLLKFKQIFSHQNFFPWLIQRLVHKNTLLSRFPTMFVTVVNNAYQHRYSPLWLLHFPEFLFRWSVVWDAQSSVWTLLSVASKSPPVVSGRIPAARKRWTLF